MEQEFTTIADFVKKTGVSRTRTFRLIRAGVIPARKLEARTLIEVRPALAYLHSLPPAGQAARKRERGI